MRKSPSGDTGALTVQMIDYGQFLSSLVEERPWSTLGLRPRHSVCLFAGLVDPIENTAMLWWQWTLKDESFSQHMLSEGLLYVSVLLVET